MSTFHLIAGLLVITAGFSYLNLRFVRFPASIGLMAISLVFSLALILVGEVGWFPEMEHTARDVVSRIDFDRVLLHGMLGILLFAGALHINLEDLAAEKWIIALLATLGVMLSTLLVAGMTYGLLWALGLPIPFIYCLVFGTLISPTDPIAVLAIMKTLGVPRALETKIAGESLFNDGVAVVMYTVVLGVAIGDYEPTASAIGLLFLEEAVGGVLFGLAAGYLAYRLLKTVDHYQVEVMITLALVFGGYALAEALHVSAPIAAVTSGLLIGNHGRVFAMSEKTTEHVNLFWELIDEILNGVLFVLVGLEVLLLEIKIPYLLAGLGAIPVVLLARLLGVALPVWMMKLRRTFSPHVIKILTWGGLRGGISVALALAMPPSSFRDLILAMTYVVVVFSILVQGLSIGALIERKLP